MIYINLADGLELKRKPYERQEPEQAKEPKVPTLPAYRRDPKLLGTLWYLGRVPETIGSYHAVAKELGIADPIEGHLRRSPKLGRHWLLVAGG